MGDVADVQTITSLSVVVPPSNYVIGNTISRKGCGSLTGESREPRRRGTGLLGRSAIPHPCLVYFRLSIDCLKEFVYGNGYQKESKKRKGSIKLG
jgi:hypothetical protein